MDNEFEYKKPAVETIKVDLPSGNKILMEKPSRATLLCQLGRLPQMMANGSFEKWKLGDVSDVQPQDQAELIKATVQLTDLMLELSVKPKLVIEPTNKPGELWLAKVEDPDIDYLLKWVASGGNTAAIAATFPRGQSPGAVVSKNRHARRAKAKQAGGVN